MNLETRIANECLLSVLRTIKYSELPKDTQKLLMECIGQALCRYSRSDQDISETIQRVEYTLYRSSLPEFYKQFLKELDNG